MDDSSMSPDYSTPNSAPESVEPVNNPNIPPVSNIPTSAMPPQSSKKKTVLLVLIVILLVIGAAYAGYKWEHNRAVKVENQQSAQILALQAQVNVLNKKVNDLNNQISASKTTPSSSSGAGSTSTSSLSIPELGVKLTFASPISKVSYAPKATPTGQYGLTDADLQKAVPSCSAAQSPLGTIYVLNSVPDLNTAGVTHYQKLSNGKYLVWRGNTGGSCDVSSNGSYLYSGADKDTTTIINSIKTATPL